MNIGYCVLEVEAESKSSAAKAELEAKFLKAALTSNTNSKYMHIYVDRGKLLAESV